MSGPDVTFAPDHFVASGKMIRNQLDLAFARGGAITMVPGVHASDMTVQEIEEEDGTRFAVIGLRVPPPPGVGGPGRALFVAYDASELRSLAMALLSTANDLCGGVSKQ